jgi:hypothetical protein
LELLRSKDSRVLKRGPKLKNYKNPFRFALSFGGAIADRSIRDGLDYPYEDASKHFRFAGTRATCQMEAEVEIPSLDFSWKSDPLNASKCDFVIVGEEANGRYYDV